MSYDEVGYCTGCRHTLYRRAVWKVLVERHLPTAVFAEESYKPLPTQRVPVFEYRSVWQGEAITACPGCGSKIEGAS